MTNSEHTLNGAEFLSNNTAGLCEPEGFESLSAAAERSSKHNRGVTSAIPQFQAWRDAANAVKRYAVANLDKLLVEFERNITARGATVLYARNAREAVPYSTYFCMKDGSSVTSADAVISVGWMR